MIEMEPPTTFLPPHQMYAGELPFMDISEYIASRGITNSTMLKSTFKQGLGALIWLHRTRPDIGFTITQIATHIAEACESPEKSKKGRQSV